MLAAILAFSWCGSLVYAQSRRGNVRRDSYETRLEGTLLDFNANALLVETEGGAKTPIQVNGDTRIQVRAPGDAKLLKQGAIVEVFGTATSPTVITDARITVYLGNGPQLSRYGRTYLAEAKSRDAIPVVLIAQVMKEKPLIVRASNSVASEFYFPEETDAEGRPNRTHLFPSLGKTFEVHPRDKEEGVMLDLGPAVALAGKGAEVHATITNQTDIARYIYVFRREPLTEEELNPLRKGKVDSKSRRSRRDTTSGSKRKSRSKDDGNEPAKGNN
ncbi:MAG: hypothetical protein U1D30_04630 [Planctomycetota bacterium]